MAASKTFWNVKFNNYVHSLQTSAYFKKLELFLDMAFIQQSDEKLGPLTDI